MLRIDFTKSVHYIDPCRNNSGSILWGVKQAVIYYRNVKFCQCVNVATVAQE